MIIFFYGPDFYRIKMDGEVVKEKYLKKYSQSGISAFDLSEKGQLEKLVLTAGNLSFFSESKLLLVRNSFDDKNIAGKLLEFLERAGAREDKNTVYLFQESGDEKTLTSFHNPLFSFLVSKGNTVKKYEYLTPVLALKWLKNEFEKLGVLADQESAAEILNNEGADSWALANAALKLSNFCRPGAVKLADVQNLLSEKIELNIFSFIDALANRKNEQAFRLLYKEIENGRDPHYVLSMIVYQFRTLLAVKDGNRSGLHPYVLSKMTKAAALFTIDELKNIYNQLFLLDVGAKNGTLDLEDGLYKLVLH